MKLSTKMTLVAVAFAVPALLLGRVIWPDPVDSMMTLTASQLPYFIFIAVLEAVAFGIGVAFLFFGWRLLESVQIDKTGKTWLLIAITWTLVSWWPHDNMHRANGEDMAGLLRIEYIFHLTLIVAAVIIARQFWKLLQTSEETHPR